MSPIVSIILLVFLGLLLLLLEVLIIPGITIAGIGGILLIGGSVWVAFDSYGITGGIVTITVSAVLLIIVFIIALRSKTWKKLALNTNIESAIESFAGQVPKVGEEGTTISRLAPMGKVQINNFEYEARSQNSYIDENSEITVIAVESNKVIVKLK